MTFTFLNNIFDGMKSNLQNEINGKKNIKLKHQKYIPLKN